MIKVSKWVSLMLVVVLVFTLSACSGSNSNDNADNSGASGATKVVFWAPFSGPDGQYMKDMVKKFNEENQGKINVDLNIVPQNQYYNMIDLAFSGKQTLPNLMIMHTDQIPTYASKGLLEDLGTFVQKAGLKESDFAITAWNASLINGKRYGIPLDIHPLVLYWNKDLFKAANLDPEKPPKTREEFLQYAQKLTDVSKEQYGFVVPTLWPQQFIFPTVLYQNGGQLADASTKKVTFNSQEGVEALQFLKDLIFEYKVSPANVQQDGEVTLFKQGKNAMHLNGPWMMAAWEEAKINYGVAPVPMLGTKEQSVYANGHNFVIPASVNDEKINEAAQTFMKWISENAIDWAKSGQAPASVKVRESQEFKDMYQQPKVAEEFEYAKFSPQIEKWGQISNPLWENVNLALLNKLPVKQALDEAAKKAQQIIDEQK
ncbi:ABC transporter substrate-binding protein [Tepidibacillus sp. HK-1]|uniref:ABC transporter substrate-binding protein n=1 Tax=Tepidibacillus sp. HK-1 TaxID=1883407 RepID=UPI000852BAD9|nr:ABC transporter substrate-binding protein [Tepidibacillus sp. HK-1]GBF10440.1 cyclodextrin-binding protein precursor [Tepidibacillus sp. HK-1]